MKELFKNWAFQMGIGILLGGALIFTAAGIGVACSGEPTEINAAMESIKASGYREQKVDNEYGMDALKNVISMTYSAANIESAYTIHNRNGRIVTYVLDVGSAHDAYIITTRTIAVGVDNVDMEAIGELVFVNLNRDTYDDYEKIIDDYWRIYE